MSDERVSYRIEGEAEQVEQERRRLELLTAERDASTFERLERLGIAAGWRCLEVGAGSGTVARWMSERVGPRGSVLSVDVDTRFHCEVGPNVEVRQQDVTAEAPAAGEFELVHARALLEHLHQREAVVDALVDALRPGGWIALESGDWSLYERQDLPEPFGSVSLGALRFGAKHTGMDPYCGSWLLPALRRRGLLDVDSSGSVWTMRGGTPSAEWYVAAIERARDVFVKAGLFDAATVEAALAQARQPDFAILSPVSLCAWGRKRVF